MLEPDSTSAPSPKSASPKSSTSTPFLKSGRRPTSGAGREKAAFLFGDDGGDEGAAPAAVAGVKSDVDEVFSLEPIKSSSDRE
jgi:TBC1 domain family protein 5